jgi:hypothetical protein
LPAADSIAQSAILSRMDALAFLRAHLPDGDDGFLEENVRLAMLVRHETPCGMAVPEDVFLDYVLPHRFLDEAPCDWRSDLYARFAELARRSASIEDCVSMLNRAVFEQYDVTYHPIKRPFNNMNVAESRACGYASCTGLSIMLAAACRAVGIPARIVGTPMWADESGNHTWVEVWDHGTWHFIGASESGPYDLCWFNDKARIAATIYAARYSPGDCSFPLAWESAHTVHADDVTQRYRSIAPTPSNATDIITEPRGYVAPRVAGPIALTGRMDDPQWSDVPWTADFVDIEGHRKPVPRFRTRARICWDDDFLYVGAEIEDPHVWAKLTEKNSFIFNDPDFEVFVDPDGDHHDYYEFEINPLGTIWELWLEKPYRDGGPVHRGHNLDGVRYAVVVDGTLNDPSDTDRGWGVEIAFPWTALAQFAKQTACPPVDGDRWRFNFSRVHWLADIVEGAYQRVPRDAHPEDNWVWTPQDAIDMHRPEKWGWVEFADAPRELGVDETWPAREILMDAYRQHRAGQAFVERGVRHASLSELRFVDDPWSGLVRCAGRVFAVDAAGRFAEVAD